MSVPTEPGAWWWECAGVRECVNVVIDPDGMGLIFNTCDYGLQRIDVYGKCLGAFVSRIADYDPEAIPTSRIASCLNTILAMAHEAYLSDNVIVADRILREGCRAELLCRDPNGIGFVYAPGWPKLEGE